MRVPPKKLVCSLLGLTLLLGCGGSVCTVTGVSVFPDTTFADHNAVSPGNGVHFFAFSTVTGSCVSAQKSPVPQSSLRNVTWSVSDPVNVSIGNMQDLNYGTATCLNSTATPVTVTATLPASANHDKKFVGTAKLTCQ